MSPFEAIAFLLLGLLVLVLTVAGAGVMWAAGAERRKIDVLAHTPCPVCREPLGRAAVDAGRLRAHEALQAKLDAGADPDSDLPQPSAAYDFLPLWQITCPRCQTGLHFDSQRRAWVDIKHPYEVD